MTAYALDTNALIDLANGRGGAAHLRRALDDAAEHGAEIVTSSWCVVELLYGAQISARPKVQLAAAEGVLVLTRVVEFDEEDGRTVARLRAEMSARGARLPAFDALIAGHALRRGWTLVTHNTRDFARVPGLSITDWSAP